MSLTNCGHLSLQKSNGRPLCPKCRAPMWNIRVQAEKAADIRERSNVHAANIRTLQCSMTILVRQPQNSDRESALCDRHFFTRKSASARNASLERTEANAAFKRANEQLFGSQGAASPVRKIDPVTGDVIAIIKPD